jgi:hypothetical protein
LGQNPLGPKIGLGCEELTHPAWKSRTVIGDRFMRGHKLSLVFCVVLLFAASAIRLMTYHRYLPFTDYSDENNYFMLALDWRGTDMAKLYGAERIGEWLGSYLHG